MGKTYSVELNNEQINLILRIANLRGNQLMSRHTKGADWELGQLDSLHDHFFKVLNEQSDFNKLTQE